MSSHRIRTEIACEIERGGREGGPVTRERGAWPAGKVKSSVVEVEGLEKTACMSHGVNKPYVNCEFVWNPPSKEVFFR